jgi:GMP synthase (glutamine-hydrolysing)
LKPILILKLGSTYPFLSVKYGDFEDWIKSYLEPISQEFSIIDVQAIRNFPDPKKYSGIILTGSHATIMDREDWSERTAAWLPKVIDKEIPLLGICYGHQLIAHAMGGIVDNNPRGSEFGTMEITLTETAKKDALWDNLPEKVFVHTGHKQSVVKLPRGAKVLASSKRDPHTAFVIPPSTWGTQFHPEYNEIIVSGYVKEAVEALQAEGQDPDQIQREIKPALEVQSILTNFSKLISRT